MRKTTKKQTESQSTLAQKLGVSRQLIGAHIKHPDAPALSDVAGWTAYLAAKGRSGSAPPELRAAIARERLRLLRASAERLEYDNQCKRGELMEVSEARRQAAEAWAWLFAELERWQRELPPSLAGLTAVEAAKFLDGCTESLRRGARAKFEKVGGQNK